jgi:hypothetical protein
LYHCTSWRLHHLSLVSYASPSFHKKAGYLPLFAEWICSLLCISAACGYNASCYIKNSDHLPNTGKWGGVNACVICPLDFPFHYACSVQWNSQWCFNCHVLNIHVVWPLILLLLDDRRASVWNFLWIRCAGDNEHCLLQYSYSYYTVCH